MEKTSEGTWNPMYMGIQDTFFNPNCEHPMDQSHLFESALSSIVSSPSHPISNDSIVLRELIGRLGSICNSTSISPQSCINTPLNSPPKLNLSITDHQNGQFVTNPGFVERAARFSAFGGSQIDKKVLGDSPSVSGNEIRGGSSNGRKRKGVPKGKGKQAQSSSSKDDKAVAEAEKEEESDVKRSKSNEEKKGNEKSTEPPKDYIHVRARRGQATDSHSLAERVRREKISERMKFLQDLVPGCNKVTGKAVMLDEIINYVQSLQQQVEFLSMKLATVNPRMDASMEALLSKDMFRPQVSLPNNVSPFDASVQPFPYGFQSEINGNMAHDAPENQFSMNPLMAAMHRNSIMKPPHIDGFGEASTFWENDLQSVVKMAIGQDQPQGFHHGQMKVEL